MRTVRTNVATPLKFILLVFVAALSLAAQEEKKDAAAIWLMTPASERAATDTLGLPTGVDQRTMDELKAKYLKLMKENYKPLPGFKKDTPKSIFELIADAKKKKGKVQLVVQKLMIDIGTEKLEMPYMVIRKEKAPIPSGDRRLFICMHGGGGNGKAKGPHAWDVNTREFNTQIQLAIRYYAPEGFYFVPRMADDRRGRWWKQWNQIAFDKLIDNAVLNWGVDPNKVYILGISEGGYGTDILAPWMADRFAGANAMAAGVGLGNPPANLRNLAFRTDVGEKDNMFKRSPMAQAFHKELDHLHKADPEGYIHSINVQPGRGHGIDYRPGVKWIAKHVRNPWPNKVVWVSQPLHEKRRDRFYWLALDNSKLPEKGRVEVIATADRKTNIIDVTANQVEWSNNDGNMTHSTTKEGKKTPLSGKKVRLLLSDTLVNLDEPVTVSVNCKSVFRGKVKRSAAVLLRELAARPDPAAAPTAELVIEVP